MTGINIGLLTYLLRGLSPQANYTDRATAACRRVPTSAARGCHVVSVTDPYGRILKFLDRNIGLLRTQNTSQFWTS
jgi:hypothetical protein